MLSFFKTMSLSTGILKGDQCIHYGLLQSSCIVVHVLKWPWTSTIMFIYLRPWSLKFSYYEISTLQRSGVSFNQKKGSDKGRRTKKSRSDIIYNLFPTHLFGHIMHFFLNIHMQTAIQDTNLSSKSCEGLNEDSSLCCHVKTTSNPSSFQGFGGTMHFSHLHQAWHFILSNLDAFSAPISQADIGYNYSMTFYWELNLENCKITAWNWCA